jgi:predicted nucleotidyltransferase
VMNNLEIIEYLRVEVATVSREIPNTTCFLFGSAAINALAASDVDVLILCSGDEEAITVRQKLAGTCLHFPLHLLVVTQEEERELNFIATQSCLRIYPD